MEISTYDRLPEDLAVVIFVDFECNNPENPCGYAESIEVFGPYPRLTEEGYIETGPDVPDTCPGCDSPYIRLNETEIYTDHGDD